MLDKEALTDRYTSFTFDISSQLMFNQRPMLDVNMRYMEDGEPKVVFADLVDLDVEEKALEPGSFAHGFVVYKKMMWFSSTFFVNKKNTKFWNNSKYLWTFRRNQK